MNKVGQLVFLATALPELVAFLVRNKLIDK